MTQSYNWYYIDHDSELIIPDPGNIWKFDFYIFSHPGNTGTLVFSIFSYPGNIGNRVFLIAWYPGNTGGGRAEAGGRLQGLCCAALDYFWDPVPGLGICRDVFTTFVLLWSHPAGFFFCQKQHFSNFWTCPISRNSTFPWFWSVFGSIWSLLNLIEPYWALLSLVEPYWTLLNLIEPYWALLDLNS